MPVLSQRLGQLHAQAVHFEVIAVGILGEQLGRVVGDRLPHRDQVHRQHVDLAGELGGLPGPVEVRQAQPAVAALAREGEAELFGRVRPGFGEHE